MEVAELNHWWIEKRVRQEFVPHTYRTLFNTIKANLNRKQIQLITGLRRVGKSTIFFQLIEQLLKSDVNPLHILYCNFDKPEFQEQLIEDILKEYSRVTDVEYKKTKIWLFLDEAQKAKNWISSVKLIYDNLPNIKLLISGSASLNILSEAKKSLAGRAIYHELKPLSFGEFLDLRGVRIEKSKYLLYKDALEKEFDKFLLRPFPELVNESDIGFIKDYVRTAVIEPIILKDIPKEFKGVDILLLEKLVNIFLSNPGQYLNLDELAKELRRTKTTLYKALFYLEFSFLIRKILNYRPSIRAASRKLSRIYPYHPCLTIPFRVPEEKFVENLVMFELDARYYWRESGKEIDFLKDHCPVEVKFKSKIDKADIRGIKYFMEKYGRALSITQAHIITKCVTGKIDHIILTPLWQFCFVGI